MRAGTIYAISARRPDDPDRIHRWAYVGQTRRSIHERFRQHLYHQPFSDLEPQVRALIKYKHCPDWLLTLTEWSVIVIVRPIYNGQWNRLNPRRISRVRAREQRAERDRPAREAREQAQRVDREAREQAQRDALECERVEKVRAACAAADLRGEVVTLSEAVPHMAGMTLNALRVASKREGFPTPVDRPGAGSASRYLFDDLAQWRERHPARV